jgi:aquaporin Z
MIAALRQHWPEYLMEAAGLGCFMISACVFAVAIGHPASPVHPAGASPVLRRLLMGIAMGLTGVAIVYSPWGKQSGAHINPSITLTFARLGKVAPWDAAFYVLAQFVGAALGLAAGALVLGRLVAAAPIRYVATTPGPWGAGAAFATELVMSFVLMTAVLWASNSARAARFTGLIAGMLVATYITLAAPLSGMSMNPARSFAPAAAAGLWDTLWVYFTAPPLGMLSAAEVYIWIRGRRRVACAKLHHQNSRRCIFRCGYAADPGGRERTARAVPAAPSAARLVLARFCRYGDRAAGLGRNRDGGGMVPADVLRARRRHRRAIAAR